MHGIVQQVLQQNGLGRPFTVNTRNGQRCGVVKMVNDRFGNHAAFRFVCDSMCNLIPKRASKSCRIGGGAQQGSSFQSAGNVGTINFVR